MAELTIRQAYEQSLETLGSNVKKGEHLNAFIGIEEAGFDLDGPVSQLNNRKAVDLLDSIKGGMTTGKHGVVRRFINIYNEALDDPSKAGNIYHNKVVKKLTGLDKVGIPKIHKLATVADGGFSRYVKSINSTISELDQIAKTGKGSGKTFELITASGGREMPIENIKGKAHSLKTWLIMRSSTGAREEALKNLKAHNYDVSEGKIYDAIRKAKGTDYIPVSYDLGEYHQRTMLQQLKFAKGKNWAGGAWFHQPRRMNELIEGILKPVFRENGVVWKDPHGKPNVFKIHMLRNQLGKTAVTLYGLERGKQILGHTVHDTILTHYAAGKGLSAFDINQIQTSTGVKSISQAGDLDDLIKTVFSEAQGKNIIDTAKVHGIDIGGTSLSTQGPVDPKKLKIITQNLNKSDPLLNAQVGETLDVIDSNSTPANIETYDEKVNEVVDSVEEKKGSIETDKIKKTKFKTSSLRSLMDMTNKFGKGSAKAVPWIGAGLSAAAAADYLLQPTEVYADEAWGGLLSSPAQVKAATVAVESLGTVAPIAATWVGLGTKEQRQAIDQPRAAREALDIESDFAIMQEHPDSPVAFGVPTKKYDIRGEWQQKIAEKRAEQWVGDNEKNPENEDEDEDEQMNNLFLR